MKSFNAIMLFLIFSFIIIVRFILQFIQNQRCKQILQRHHLWKQTLSQKSTSTKQLNHSRIYLVTGGCGFVGTRLVNYLLQQEPDIKIRVFDVIDKPSTDRIEFIKGDICNKEQMRRACEGVNTVFHIASLVSTFGSIEPFLRINVLGTQNVIDACIACGVQKLIFASSCEAANGTHTKILTSKDPIALSNPSSHYGFTKGLAEQSVLEANGICGLATCVLASMLIWGPGDKQFYELSKKLKFNSCIGDGENYWETLYVDNACHAFWLASKHLDSKSPLAGKKYYISDEFPIKMKDFMTMFFSTMQGRDVPTQFAIPVWILFPIAYLLEWICWLLEPIVKINPILTPVMIHSSTIQYKFDLSDTKKDLKYSPIVSMKEGMLACKKYAEQEQKR